MAGLSVSFTLGKASVLHGANVEHNNRGFVAKNVDKNKIKDNVTYVKQDVREAYSELFGKSVEAYNGNRKRNDRKIDDYYERIANGKREEAFYEIVVQFGDSKTSPCGSENGKIVQGLLDEYIKGFRDRNPNLHIFNAVLHMDEASPHLHINFIPFYTKGRVNGLNKGVSMKAALDEQGFTAKNFKENRLVAWEESERAAMESILNSHGMSREDKQAHYTHMTVDEYKEKQDEKKVVELLKKSLQITNNDLAIQNVRNLKSQVVFLEREKEKLEIQKKSPYNSFYYSAPEKQAYVQARLDELEIPYRETENGFEAQEYYVDKIRKIEKEYKPVRSSAREQVREDIDRLLMQSGSLEELLKKLESEKYSVKYGKYIAVKPYYAERYIRLKTLGELYSEFALKNRIAEKKKYEDSIQRKIDEPKHEKGSAKLISVSTIRLYTIAISKGALPLRKREKQKPFSWKNDSELDKLLLLNQKINNGVTLQTLKEDFENQERKCNSIVAERQKSEADLKAFYELKEKIEIVFEGKASKLFSRQQAENDLMRHPNITESNYKNIDILINNEISNLKKVESELSSEQQKLKECADLYSAAEKIFGGTYVQSLVADERERRESKYVSNGLKDST